MAAGRPGPALFRAVVTHPVAVSMVFMAALVFGWVSYQRLAVELMPDISYPTITVRTTYDGAAPQEVESQVSRPIEEALATLDGLVLMESRSRAGGSDVILGFDWGTDMDGASQSIRESLQTTWLPQEADRPLILRYDPSLDPFLRLAVSADPGAPGAQLPEDPAARLARVRLLAEGELKRALEGVGGVAAVRVQGGLEPEIRIEVVQDWLTARQITLEQVKNALVAENINVAGGSITEGDVAYLIRTLNEYTSVEDLRTLEIRRSDGERVPLVEVARVIEGHKERDVISRLDEGEAVELEVFKEADANIVEVARRMQLALEGDGLPKMWGGKGGLKDDLPPGVRLTVLDNQATFIELAVNNLRSTAIVGGLFAVGVLFLFLRDFRSTAIVGMAIPVSVVIGFAPLYLLDISLNLMSLGGLALGVGMLVDNAVVVLESIQRYREEGQERADAAVSGVVDVATAVTASTLTTVAVFFPISFVEGVGGELFGDLSLAVVSSLLASLAVALFLVPMMAAQELPSLDRLSRGSLIGALPRGPDQGRVAWLRGLWREVVARAWTPARADLTAAWSRVRERKRRILWFPWALARALGFVCVVGSWMLTSLLSAMAGRLALRLVGLAVRPAARVAHAAATRFHAVYAVAERRYRDSLGGLLQRPGFVLGTAGALFVAALAGTGQLGTELIPELHQGRFAVELSLPVGTPLERTSRVAGEAERIVRSHPQVASVYATVGVDPRADARSDEGEHTARLRVQLVEGGDLRDRERRTAEDLRKALAVIPRLEAKIVRPVLFSFRTPVEVVVFGYDLDTLRQIGIEIAGELGEVPGLRDVRSSLVRGHPEVRIQYDRRRLHRLGLDPATVAQRVRDKVQGVVATRIHKGEQRVGLMVQLVEDERSSIANLSAINVNPQLLPPIPLSAVADFEEAVGPSEIRRVDQQRAVVISANLVGFDLGSARTDIEGVLGGVVLPDGVSWGVGGQSREMEESLASLRFALALAVFLVYVIMASTFENLVHPLVILFSVPLAVVGAVLALALVGSPVSVVVLIGVIVLAGVVVNNAIVLVDTINRLHADGAPRDAAIQQASLLRLRPILITTATTVLGLTPLAMGLGAGAEMQGPLAVTVIGGLLSSTLLTLVVIPVVYRVFARAPAGAPAAVPDDGASPA